MKGNVKDLLQKALGQSPLFGKQIANKARRGGVTVHHAGEKAVDNITDHVPRALGGDIWSRLAALLRPDSTKGMGHAYANKHIRDKGGIHVDFVGRGQGGAAPDVHFLGRARNDLEKVRNSKLDEANYFGDLLPRTERLSHVMKRVGVDKSDPDAVMAALSKEFGGRFIVKPNRGYATSSDALVTDKHGGDALRRMFQEGMKNNQGATFTGNPSHLVVQNRLDLRPITRIERASNNFAEAYRQGRVGDLKFLADPKGKDFQKGKDMASALLGGKLPFKALGSTSGGTAREYRMHVVDGKVVPYATVGRGSMLSAIPLRMPGHGAAERSIQKQLDGMDPKKLKGTFGMDVMKTRDGQYRVIETNPSGNGGSGFAPTGAIQEAISAAIQGRLPRHILAQRAAATGLAGAGTAAGINALSSQPDDS